MSFCVVVLLAASFAFAQGGDGRTESFDASNSVGPKTKMAKTTYRRPAKARPDSPKPGTLLMSVDQPLSDISLTRTDELSMQPQSITTNGPITRSLRAGNYQLRFRKYGYFEEMRNLNISPGEYRTVNVTMRPQMALLTVKTNLDDTEIDVERAGTFNKPLKRFLILPGIYQITLKRRGYVSKTITADLSIPGKEQSYYVVLEPMRID